MTTEHQRNMLEAAAKACGYGELIFCNGADDDGYDNDVWKYTLRRDESGRLLLWNSLTNPADTAEMCARLEIDTRWHMNREAVECIYKQDAWPAYRAFAKDHDNSRLKAWMAAATIVAAKIEGYES